MDRRIQIIIIVAAVCALLAMFQMIRKNRLELRYALSWIVVDVLVILFSVFPKSIETLAKLMGIATPVNMLFFLGFCFSLVLLFRLNAAVSRLSGKVTRLTQTIAVLQEELKRLRSEE